MEETMKKIFMLDKKIKKLTAEEKELKKGIEDMFIEQSRRNYDGTYYKITYRNGYDREKVDLERMKNDDPFLFSRVKEYISLSYTAPGFAWSAVKK